MLLGAHIFALLNQSKKTCDFLTTCKICNEPIHFTDEYIQKVFKTSDTSTLTCYIHKECDAKDDSAE